MNIQYIETFWRDDEDGEYGARYTAKYFWSGFGDAWCWENDAVPLGITLATIDEIDSLTNQFSLFRNSAGPGIMILGAHGRDPEDGQRHLLIRNNQGHAVPISWSEIRGMLQAGDSVDLRRKLLIIDSCSFCSDGEEAMKTVAETRLGMLCGFEKDVEPIDSMLFEVAFVNYLLWEWWDGKRAFVADFLQASKNPFGKKFLQRYESLYGALGFRAWRWTGEHAEEMILSDLISADR